MKRKMLAGATSVMLPISVLDTTSGSGAGLAGLLFNTAGLVAEYRRQGQSSSTAISLVTATLGTWTSGGFIADGTRGDYELGIPDAALAAGAKWVVIRLYGVTAMLDVKIEIELDAVNYQDAVRFGLTGIPNAAAGAAGGLPTGDAAGHVTLAAATHTGAVLPRVTLADTTTTVTNAVQVDLTQPLTNVATATVGGALHGSWILAFGKVIRDATAKTLTYFGMSGTAIKVHDLDDGTNPTTRTPQ